MFGDAKPEPFWDEQSGWSYNDRELLPHTLLMRYTIDLHPSQCQPIIRYLILVFAVRKYLRCVLKCQPMVQFSSALNDSWRQPVFRMHMNMNTRMCAHSGCICRVHTAWCNEASYPVNSLGEMLVYCGLSDSRLKWQRGQTLMWNTYWQEWKITVVGYPV